MCLVHHFDGLGNVIALSDPNGDTVQTYPSGPGPAETGEYSVYGEVAAEDVNHPATAGFAETSPNLIVFTGHCPRNSGRYTMQQIYCSAAHKKWLPRKVSHLPNSIGPALMPYGVPLSEMLV
jgi:hypothetical protein